jgi:hypothetical protein
MSVQSSHSASTRSVIRAKEVAKSQDCFDVDHKAKRGRWAGNDCRPHNRIDGGG